MNLSNELSLALYFNFIRELYFYLPIKFFFYKLYNIFVLFLFTKFKYLIQDHILIFLL